MVERIDSDVRQSMRQQVAAYLLERVQMELPSKLSEKQTQRVAQRRAMSLLQRGVPSDKILANIEVIKEGSDVEAVRELKLLFVLQKIAEERGIEVSESELNGQIAIIAIQSGKRPEKVKQELAANGQLAQLYIQLREQRTLDSLLEQAQIEEVDGPEQKKD